MNSKNKGNIGEAKALSKFIELGLPVYIPFGDNERADLVVEFYGKLNKIQVKSATMKSNNTCTFPLYSFTNTRANNGKGYNKYFYRDQIDYYIFYNLTLDCLYLYKNEDIQKDAITLRYSPSLNNQTKNILYYNDNSFDNLN